MTVLRILFAAFLLAGAPLAMTAASSPASAQLFEPRYYPPQQRRLPSGDNYRRRQYVPEQNNQRPRRGFFERLFGLPEREPREAPTRRVAPADAGDSEPAAPVKKAVPKTTFVAVIGDSFAQDLVPGLTDALSERPEVGLVREIRPGVGFLKETDKTWRMVVDEVLARDPAVTAAVVFMGPDDDPPVKKKKKAPEPVEAAPETEDTVPALTASPWMDRYAAKVDDVALAFRQRNIPLIWIGLPPVEDEKTTADHLFLNDLVRQRVAALGGIFIDVWEGFVDTEEKFTVQGPDIEGRVVRLRTADGVHFTRAGSRKIGHSIEIELRPYLAPKDSGDNIADLMHLDSTAPTTPGSSRILLLGQAPRAPGAQLVPGERTDADRSAEKASAGEKFEPGVLASDGTAKEDSAAKADATPKEKALPPPAGPENKAVLTGEAVPARPGRADDFAWPQTAVN